MFIASIESPMDEYLALKLQARVLKSLLEERESVFETTDATLPMLRELYDDVRTAMKRMMRLRRTPFLDGCATSIEPEGYNLYRAIDELIASVREILTWIERNLPDTAPLTPPNQWAGDNLVQFSLKPAKTKPLRQLMRAVVEAIQ